MSNLKLHEAMAITFEDWYCQRTMIGSVYEINEGAVGKRYRIVDIENQTEIIDDSKIISVADCELSENEKSLFVELSKLHASLAEEERKYQKLQSDIKSVAKEINLKKKVSA